MQVYLALELFKNFFITQYPTKENENLNQA